jgi:hypothetical protein
MLALQVRKPQISFQPERMETPVDVPRDGVCRLTYARVPSTILCEDILSYHHPSV